MQLLVFEYELLIVVFEGLANLENTLCIFATLFGGFLQEWR